MQLGGPFGEHDRLTRYRGRPFNGAGRRRALGTPVHPQQMTRMPLIPVPAGFRFQPVDPSEVATRLVELALDSPAGLAPPFDGPRIYGMADLAHDHLTDGDKHRPVLPIRLPGKATRAFRSACESRSG